MSLNSMIGPFNFVNLSLAGSVSGPPPSPHEQVVPIQRYGVNGVAFVLCGEKGQPFQMRGFALETNINDAEQLEMEYKALIGAGTFSITWGGNVIASHEYVVIDVQVIRVQKCGASSSGDGAFCESLWTLCAVAV